MNSLGRENDRAEDRGPRARMQRALLATALDLMQQGRIPSVSDVAEAAGVSRATAYRYFPSQGAMIQAAYEEALRPVFAWHSTTGAASERIAELLSFAYPQIDEYEATHRATLQMALDQWSRRKAGTLGSEAKIVRGNRRRMLAEASSPLRDRMGKAEFERLNQALSLLFGVEALLVLKDIWGLERDQARDVALWAASALVAAAENEGRNGPTVGTKPRTPRKGSTGGTRKLN